jgi:membrane-associated phospholipid phosphatase
MALPSLGLLLSTIYLRYHYGVDLLAAFLLFLALRQTLLKFEARKKGLTQ